MSEATIPPLVGTAKQALAAWTKENVPDATKRGELSKLVAAYVAAAVRQDRAERQVMADVDAVAAALRQGRA